MTVPTRHALYARSASCRAGRPLAHSMRLAALRSAVAVLALTVGLAGCADGTAPTAPSPALGASEPALAARGGTALPFRGMLEARESGQFQPATRTVLVRLEGTGTASHLGRYTLASEFTLSPATLTAAGHITFTAANGDLLFATFTGRSVVAGGIVTIVEALTITGGTGRFAGATGSATLQRTLTRATGVSSGSFEGTLDLNRGK